MNAIILAGGRGSRLAPWHAPKCLLLIRGISILDRILHHLLDSREVDKVVVCAGYRVDDVFNHVDNVAWDPTWLKVADGGEDTAMGARLLAARELATSQRVLILYGDELADVDLKALVHKHESASAKMTFAVTATPMPGGTLQATGEGDKCVINEHATRVVNIGFVVVEPECWECLKPEDGLSDWINRMGDDAHAYYHTGKRATVNSLADLEYAEEVWR